MAIAQFTWDPVAVLAMKVYDSRLKTKIIMETFRNESKRPGEFLQLFRGQMLTGSQGWRVPESLGMEKWNR